MWEINISEAVGKDPFEGHIKDIIRRSEQSPDTLYCFRSKFCGEAFSPYILFVDGEEIGIISEIFIIDGDAIVIPRKGNGEPSTDAAWRLHNPTSSDEDGTAGETAVKEAFVKFEHLPWWALKRPAFEDVPAFPERGKTGEFWEAYLKKYTGDNTEMVDRWRGGSRWMVGLLPEEVEESTYVEARILDGGVRL
jgi:hypothetical protein